MRGLLKKVRKQQNCLPSPQKRQKVPKTCGHCSKALIASINYSSKIRWRSSKNYDQIYLHSSLRGRTDATTSKNDSIRGLTLFIWTIAATNSAPKLENPFLQNQKLQRTNKKNLNGWTTFPLKSPQNWSISCGNPTYYKPHGSNSSIILRHYWNLPRYYIKKLYSLTLNIDCSSSSPNRNGIWAPKMDSPY